MSNSRLTYDSFTLFAYKPEDNNTAIPAFRGTPWTRPINSKGLPLI